MNMKSPFLTFYFPLSTRINRTKSFLFQLLNKVATRGEEDKSVQTVAKRRLTVATKCFFALSWWSSFFGFPFTNAADSSLLINDGHLFTEFSTTALVSTNFKTIDMQYIFKLKFPWQNY